jgi:DNA-directed RNA polymerase subunit RPC12/RpoP
MPGRFDEPDEYGEWEDDPEGPQERDLVGEDDEDTPTVPCPSCGAEILDFVDKCPHCGDWIVQRSGTPSHRRGWVVLVVILLLIAVAAVYVL